MDTIYTIVIITANAIGSPATVTVHDGRTYDYNGCALALVTAPENAACAPVGIVNDLEAMT